MLSARTEQFCAECAELNLKWALCSKALQSRKSLQILFCKSRVSFADFPALLKDWRFSCFLLFEAVRAGCVVFRMGHVNAWRRLWTAGLERQRKKNIRRQNSHTSPLPPVAKRVPRNLERRACIGGRSVEPAELDRDLKELLERLEGDQEFLRELLATFREDYRACLHKVHRAMAESNLPELSRAAHTIKGMLRNLSMNSAAQTVTALEKSAQDAAEKESAQLLLILEGDLAKILPEVEAQLAGVKA